MEQDKKYTKRASSYVMKEVFKINPKASKLTSYDQAFVILMDYWDMTMNIETGLDKETKCTLYRPWSLENIKWSFQNVFDEKIGDWDWDVIYKTVLEDIIKKKLFKKPKLGKRAQAKLDEALKAKASKVIQEPQKQQESLEDLRKLRDKLVMKIYNAKKNNSTKIDIKAVEKEVETLKVRIKNYGKFCN